MPARPCIQVAAFECKPLSHHPYHARDTEGCEHFARLDARIAIRPGICNTSRIDPAPKPLPLPSEGTLLLLPWTAWLPWTLCVVMVACLLFFAMDTLHWPLVGDAVSVHYLVLLMQHGMAPYRQIVDAQMPGTFLFDWVVLHIFGGSAPGSRLFDFALMLLAMLAMLAIAWPAGATGGFTRDDRWAALLAGGLFALVHGRDGIPQAGQRDLVMAVLLLAAYACVFHAVRADRPWLLFVGGICASTAAMIKPTIVPAAVVVFVLAIWHLWRAKRPIAAPLVAAILGNALPIAAVLIFLLREQALRAFLHGGISLMSYHASLQRRSVGYLLGHCLSPVTILLPLLLICVVARYTAGRTRSVTSHASTGWERAALYAGLLLSLISYIAQGKGFPYHRYPFLVLFLLIACCEFRYALQPATLLIGSRRRLGVCWATTGVLGLCIAVLALAPISAYKISRFEWGDDEDFRLMSTDLAAVGGSHLSGRVQCIDAFAGCVNTLYRLGLVQSTGFIVDFYFLAPDSSPIVQAMRKQFWNEIQTKPPHVFVVTKMIFPINPSAPDSYDKLKLWPQFDTYLNDHYVIAAERTPQQYVRLGNRPERPAGYRIYVRKHE